MGFFRKAHTLTRNGKAFKRRGGFVNRDKKGGDANRSREENQGMNSGLEQQAHDDGFDYNSRYSYDEDAAAILGVGYDYAATQADIKRYQDKGEEIPDELRRHADRFRYQPNLYDG